MITFKSLSENPGAIQGVDAQRMQNGLDRIRGEQTHISQGGVIWVFALNAER